MEYLKITELYGVKGLSFSQTLQAFFASLPADQELKVLDLGSGYGHKSLFMASQAWSVTALDIEPHKLAFLAKKAEEYKLSIQSVVGSMTDIPLSDKLFDAVICCSTLHHQTRHGIVRTLAEIQRVLKSGGKVFFDILSTKDPSYAIGEEIESGTKLGGREGEEGIPHHYATRTEVETLLTAYSKMDIIESEFSYAYDNKTYTCVLFEVIAVK